MASSTDETPGATPGSTERDDADRSTGRRVLAAFLWRPGVLVLVTLGLIATVVGPRLVERLPDLSDRAEYQLTRRSVDVTTARPAWVPEDYLAAVLGSDQWPAEGTSILDRGVASRVAAAFEEQPWVDEVQRVECQVPSRVVVDLVFRRPVSWVETDGDRVAVSRLGIRLPGRDIDGDLADKLPVVTGVNSTAPENDGDIWEDVRVTAAARLASDLGTHWEPFELKTIHVFLQGQTGNEADRVFLELTTLGGSRIVWGRAPGADHPGELTPRQKIGRLVQFISHFKSLDTPDGPLEINIRHWREIIYKPLGDKSAQGRVLRVLR